MRRASLVVVGALALALGIFFAVRRHTAASPPPRIEVLLNRVSADKAGMGLLRATLAVTPGKFVLLGDDKSLYAVGWGGVRPLGGISGLHSFAYTPDGLLLGVRDQELVYLDEGGSLQRLFRLPSEAMGIAAGSRDKMFLYENTNGGSSALYELLHGKRVRKLLDSPEPINAVAETEDGRIIFAAGHALYSFAPNEPMHIIAAVPGRNGIVSFARVPVDGRIFLSNGESIFAVADGKPKLVSRDAGGILRWFDGGLLVLDAKQSLLIRIVGI